MWFHSLSNWLLVVSFCAALLSAVEVTDAAQWQLMKVFFYWAITSVSNFLKWVTSALCSHPQYFFCLLLIFLIELVAGVLAYVYYQRVSGHYLLLLLFSCSCALQWKSKLQKQLNWNWTIITAFNCTPQWSLKGFARIARSHFFGLLAVCRPSAVLTLHWKKELKAFLSRLPSSDQSVLMCLILKYLADRIWDADR